MLVLALHASVALAATAGLVVALAPIARRLGLVDRPDVRKIDFRAVPVIGGLAMFAGFLLALGVLGSSAGSLSGVAALMAGLAAFLALGVVDDLLDLHPYVKLAWQAAAALAMVALGQSLIGPADLLGTAPFHAPLLHGLTTVLFIVGLSNALNMLDGLDGLAGGAAFAMLAGLAVAASILGMAGTVATIVLLLAAIAGFLLFNVRQPWRRAASVFMGDAGSLMLGAAVAAFMLDVAAEASSAGKPALPALLWLVALPVFDTLILIARRLAAGRNPLRGDCCHIHHVLLQAGFSVAVATAILAGLCGAYALVGLLVWQSNASSGMAFASLVAPFAFHLFVVLRGWRVVGRLRAVAGGSRLGTTTSLARPKARFQ